MIPPIVIASVACLSLSLMAVIMYYASGKCHGVYVMRPAAVLV